MRYTLGEGKIPFVRLLESCAGNSLYNLSSQELSNPVQVVTSFKKVSLISAPLFSKFNLLCKSKFIIEVCQSTKQEKKIMFVEVT